MVLADIMRKSPAEIDRMPYRDSIDFITVHYERITAERKFSAELHGRILKT